MLLALAEQLGTFTTLVGGPEYVHCLLVSLTCQGHFASILVSPPPRVRPVLASPPPVLVSPLLVLMSLPAGVRPVLLSPSHTLMSSPPVLMSPVPGVGPGSCHRALDITLTGQSAVTLNCSRDPCS